MIQIYKSKKKKCLILIIFTEKGGELSNTCCAGVGESNSVFRIIKIIN